MNQGVRTDNRPAQEETREVTVEQELCKLQVTCLQQCLSVAMPTSPLTLSYQPLSTTNESSSHLLCPLHGPFLPFGKLPLAIRTVLSRVILGTSPLRPCPRFLTLSPVGRVSHCRLILPSLGHSFLLRPRTVLL
jgi:hypothetical protein